MYTSLFRINVESDESRSSNPSLVAVATGVGDTVAAECWSVASEPDDDEDDVDAAAVSSALAGSSGGRTAITIGGFSVLAAGIVGGN